MRTDKKMINELARDFARSKNAQLWYAFTDDLRNALIDTFIMQHVQMASACGADNPITPTDLILFRVAFAKALRDGVPRGSAGRIRFTLDEADDESDR